MKTGSLKTNYLKDLARFDSSLRSKIRDLRKDLLVSSPSSSVIGINKPLQAHTESEKYKTDVSTWNRKHPNPFLSGCFYWMIPNLYTKNCCFTKHPLKFGCFRYQNLWNDCRSLMENSVRCNPQELFQWSTWQVRGVDVFHWWCQNHLGNEKSLWLFRAYRGIILPSCTGIILSILNYEKDP